MPRLSSSAPFVVLCCTAHAVHERCNHREKISCGRSRDENSASDNTRPPETVHELGTVEHEHSACDGDEVAEGYNVRDSGQELAQFRHLTFWWTV